MYCYDKSTGEILWTFKALRKIDSSPVIAHNKVIIASSDGRIYLLNLDTGKKIWSYEIGSPISGTPAVLNNMIIVGAEDGKVFTFGKIK